MLGQWGEDDCRVLLAGLHKYGPDFQLLALVLPYTEEEVCERGLPMVSHSGIQIQEQYNLLREASTTPDSSGIPLSWFVVLKDVASKVEVCKHLSDTSRHVINGDPNYAHQLPSFG